MSDPLETSHDILRDWSGKNVVAPRGAAVSDQDFHMEINGKSIVEGFVFHGCNFLVGGDCTFRNCYFHRCNFAKPAKLRGCSVTNTVFEGELNASEISVLKVLDFGGGTWTQDQEIDRHCKAIENYSESGHLSCRFSHCEFWSTVLNCAGSRFSFCIFQSSARLKGDFCECSFSDCNFLRVNIKRCVLSRTKLLRCQMEGVSFESCHISNCEISKTTLWTLGPRHGGLSWYQLAGFSKIVDPLADLKRNFTGFKRWSHWTGLACFVGPYAVFICTQWIKHLVQPDAEGEMLFTQLLKFIVSHGQTHRDWQGSLAAIALFTLYLIYNVCRLWLFRIVNHLTVEQELRGIPIEFTFERAHWWTKCSIAVVRIGAWAAWIIVLINTYLYATTSVPY